MLHYLHWLPPKKYDSGIWHGNVLRIDLRQIGKIALGAETLEQIGLQTARTENKKSHLRKLGGMVFGKQF